MMEKEIKIIAAFCGTGKSYLTKNFPDRYKEIECWNYRQGDFPNNYIVALKDMINSLNDIKHVFISTDPIILKGLHELDMKFTLVYPQNELKEEYMQRYCDRDSSYDFIGVIYKHWNEWLDQLKEQINCEHVVLKRGEYLQDVL